MSVGPDEANIAAQMGAVTNNDQVATHPVWNTGDPVGQLYTMMDLPEDMTGVAQEPGEASEDAQFVDLPDVAQLTTGLPDADDLPARRR